MRDEDRGRCLNTRFLVILIPGATRTREPDGPLFAHW
jgi:hypothetical protein